MKLFVALLFPIFIVGQSKTLKDMVVGTTIAFNETWATYPKSNVRVVNSEHMDWPPITKAVIMTDFPDNNYTIVAVKINSSLAVIFGYAPGVEGGNFNGKLELYVYKLEGGQMTQLDYVYSQAEVVSENNVFKEKVSSEKSKVVVSDKFDVDYFVYKGLICYLPKGYK